MFDFVLSECIQACYRFQCTSIRVFIIIIMSFNWYFLTGGAKVLRIYRSQDPRINWLTQTVEWLFICMRIMMLTGRHVLKDQNEEVLHIPYIWIIRRTGSN